jgi:hypothetical protein
MSRPLRWALFLGLFILVMVFADWLGSAVGLLALD